MLGIKNYNPIFLNSASKFEAFHKETLFNIIGKKIECYYVQWDVHENKWNNDGPIILQIDQDQYEFTAFQLDDYSLTINQINLSEKLDWYDSEDEMPLVWKKNSFEEINSILNKEIEQLFLLEHSIISDIENNKTKKDFFKQISSLDFFLVGIEFKLKNIENCLHLSNGLDCNVMKLHTTKSDIKNKRIMIKRKTTTN